jgi:hypothetical protein
MPILTPPEAALLARRVYALRESTVSAERERGTRFGTEGKFALDDSSQFSGKTGALKWTALSNFGYVAAGVGAYQGEVLVTTRGTAIGLDWLVNLNIGMQSGPGGWAVHSGFHETWKSFEKGLTSFLRGHNPSRIHCVGHSLGGALAALTADWASSAGVAPVSLYTFGAPRVGDAVFAGALAKRVGEDNIFRVYHPADIVPMIPMLPFFHSPLVGGGLALPTGSSALFSIAAHNMEGSYMPGVAGRTRAGLVNGTGTGANDGVKMENWLEAAASGKGSFLMGSASLLSMIGRALAWLVRKAVWVIGSALGSAVTAGLTLLDQLSWLLGQAAQISKEVAGYVKGLMSAIFRFMGRKAGQAVDVTTAFIRWLLASLVTTLSAIARRALNRLI